ncbi:DNA polymerase I [Ligilactobacillus equi DSM 15833 = JCM 10991]|uniref:DNA polymerase I n=2 Tax=Ligilactobacillus equi TaxID=137357 RepID=V7HX16_9LACO|nr:DNA polymerase I [Ligilactobacillus equi]ETA74417.1 DNA polymerase I [Ligilactobacillus equi DPC 6820]KRL78765.1 DNA polymerase I [Ligilactobacillus equi DSM 15833 = JCM 10991]
MTEKLLLIDGNSVTFRAFYGLINAVERFKNTEGLHTSAIYGFKLMLDKILADEQPDRVLVAFDAGKKTFRTKKFADYKGQRSKTPSELTEQFPYVRELVAAHGIKTYALPNYEADDILGTMAKEAEAQGMEVVIVTGDRDLVQLVTDKVTVLATVKGVTEIERYTPAEVAAKYGGLNPKQIIDMKALTGDSSDNYPGVTKIGEKTAINLLTEYGSLEGIYAKVDEMKKSKRKENLINEKDIAFMCQDLARIRQDAPLEITLADTVYAGPDEVALRELYQKLDFKSFLGQLKANTVEVEFDKSLAIIDLATLTEALPQAKEVNFYLEMADDNYHTADFWGFAIQIDQQVYVSDDVLKITEAPLKDYLENQQVAVNVFDLKRTLVGLNRLGVKLSGVNFDLLLVSYLLDTSENSNDLGKLAMLHDFYGVKSDEEVYGKGAKRACPEKDLLLPHLATKVQAIGQLKSQLLNKLKANEQEILYEEIERPLAYVLGQMEIAGIKADPFCLKNMQTELASRLAAIEADIYQAAGEEFNLNSPKQLGIILFEKMGLPVIKKTKTGYSTAVDVLEKLQDQAPIIADILEYRQLAKLQSTYIEGLLKVISADGKIHTRYTQTLTATGRLSSVEPNLQNIPARLEEGRRIRQAFVPSHKGWEIFSSDYSQIELRVLAHISGDEHMQAAFKEGQDIHAATAMKIFGLEDASMVTKNLRRQAKAVNFGIVYGISDFGLAKNIGKSRKEAADFIAKYFENYPGVKKYMDESVARAKAEGFVETIFHRRRYLPDINAKNFNLRSFAERTAMNTPIQGSAADIIKVAMINVNKRLRQEGLQAKMLLQVHDELIFEAPKEEIPVLQKIIPEVMDSAVSLEVPLKVESKHGITWFDTKK